MFVRDNVIGFSSKYSPLEGIRFVQSYFFSGCSTSGATSLLITTTCEVSLTVSTSASRFPFIVLPYRKHFSGQSYVRGITGHLRRLRTPERWEKVARIEFGLSMLIEGIESQNCDEISGRSCISPGSQPRRERNSTLTSM